VRVLPGTKAGLGTVLNLSALLVGCGAQPVEMSVGATTTGAASEIHTTDEQATETDTHTSSGSSSGTTQSTTEGTTAAGTPPESIVWVGAHPDDELYAAPWLAERCLDRLDHCKLVVMTYGESGTCKHPDGCAPDLVTLRKEELAGSVALLGAELVHFDLGDGKAPTPESVLGAWAEVVGGEAALLDLLVDELKGADRLITFDPRHGESCHADHRAAGILALTAAENVGIAASQTHLIASRLVLDPAVPEDPGIYSYDASAILTSTAEPAWSTLVDVLRTYRSQFTADEVASIEAVSPAMQRTWLVDLDQTIADDPLYEGLCQ